MSGEDARRASWEALDEAREAFERRRQRRTWLLAFGVVPVLTTAGLVAAGLLRFDGAGRFSEGQELLVTLAQRQLEHREQTGRWARHFSELSLPPSQFFTCFLADDEVLRPSSPGATEVQAKELPALVDELALGVTCDEGRPCDYLAACAARWEWNGLMTVRFVTSRGLPDASRKPNVPFSPGAVP